MISRRFFSAAVAPFICSFAFAQGAATPTVQNPKVTAPKPPTVVAPAVSAPPAATPALSLARGNSVVVASRYDENAFKAAASTGAPVLLVFSGVGDTIWAQQAPVLQPILRESEFARTPAFQIDVANIELAAKYNVSIPGTLLIMKGGFERLRSTRMVKPDVIRKMLRLQSVL